MGTVLARAQRTMTVGLWQVGLSEDSEFNLYHSVPLPLDEIVSRSGHVVASILCHYLVPRGFPSVLWLHLDSPLGETMTDFCVDSSALVRYHCSGPSGIGLATE